MTFGVEKRICWPFSSIKSFIGMFTCPNSISEEGKCSIGPHAQINISIRLVFARLTVLSAECRVGRLSLFQVTETSSPEILMSFSSEKMIGLWVKSRETSKNDTLI